MKPNLFSLASKELSQDAFFAWLIIWADDSNQEFDSNLNETAKDFVRWLLSVDKDFKISCVEVKRQWYNIDIAAKINNEHLILIEDKVGSLERKNQLENYRIFADKFGSERNLTSKFIYIKTGNESESTLSKVLKPYRVFRRQDLIKVLSRSKTDNPIFLDFLENLTSIEQQTNSYKTIASLSTNWYAAKGFFLSLEENLETSGWGYVSNPSGGFLGLWFPHHNLGDLNLYIQIENFVKSPINSEWALSDVITNLGKIQVVVKASGKPNKQRLNVICAALCEFPKEDSLMIVKPKTLRSGSTSTIAIIEDVLTLTEDGLLDTISINGKLQKLNKTLRSFAAVNYRID